MRVEEAKEHSVARPAQLPSASPKARHAVQRYRKRIAVTIGVGAYHRPWTPLAATVKDAAHMRDLFRAMGFDEVIHVPQGEATREGILKVLEVDLPLLVEEQDLVVVYFAGHGATIAGQSHLAAIDSTRDLEQTGLSIDHLKEISLRLRSLHVLYLMDACFAGNMLHRSKPPQPNVLAYWEATAKDRTVQVLAAGGENELAIEANGWGLFTRALHDGLLGAADRDKDGVVTVPELGGYAGAQVTRKSAGKQHPQWGWLEGEGTALLVHELRLPPKARRQRDTASRASAAPSTSLSSTTSGALATARQLLNDRRYQRAYELLGKELLRDGLGGPEVIELRLSLAEVMLAMDPLGSSVMIDQELDRVLVASPTAEQNLRAQDLRRRLNAERNER